MSKRLKRKKKIVGVMILQEKHLAERSDKLDVATQKKVLEIYARNNHIKLEAYYHADETFVNLGDFKTFLACIKDRSFKPEIILFTSWEIVSPLLDRFPQTFQVFEKYGVKLKSIKYDIIKNALAK